MSIAGNVTTKEIKTWDNASYMIVDIRDNSSYGYGHLPEAINIPSEELVDRVSELNSAKKIVVYCMKGEISVDAANYLCEQGFEAYNLVGGYGQWLIETMQEEDKPDCKAI